MSTSTMRSEHGDTRSDMTVSPACAVDVTAPALPDRKSPLSRAFRRIRRAISIVLFGSDAVTMLDMRDINAYLETTEG